MKFPVFVKDDILAFRKETVVEFTLEFLDGKAFDAVRFQCYIQWLATHEEGSLGITYVCRCCGKRFILYPESDRRGFEGMINGTELLFAPGRFILDRY